MGVKKHHKLKRENRKVTRWHYKPHENEPNKNKIYTDRSYFKMRTSENAT